ncbi:N,N-dimethylformamidase beta subunit family domain-containing protein [Mesorhizobium atlanticum]
MLPKDAPRVPLEVAVPPKTVPRYPHMEWAFATGHSKKYASSGWASYDSRFFRFAERAGYRVDLASQHELHFSPEILNGYDCVVFVGHDEYWTWEMRDAVDNYVDRGGHAARFAGNFMWRTRLEDQGRRQVCYKYKARAEDPAYRGGDVTRATNSWEAPEIGRPGSAALRPQCNARRLCRLGRLRAARCARLPRLSSGALGLRRHRHLLWRPARCRQPCLWL